MNENKKKIVLLISLIGVILTGIGGYYLYQKHEKELALEAAIAEAELEVAVKQQFNQLFIDEKQVSVKLEVSIQSINKLKNSVNEITDIKQKKVYLKRIKNIEQFISVRDEMRQYIINGVVKSTITDENIISLQTKHQKLELGFQMVLNDTLNLIINQRKAIKEVDELANSFFNNDKVKDNIDSVLFSSFKNKLNSLPQKDIASKYDLKIKQIQEQIDKLEAIKRAQIEAERQAAIARALAESERLRRENEEIMANNVILRGVPKIDQKNGVLNGCEVASLLMGLQYKGYNQGMSLKKIAEDVPKSDNPHTGFVLDIWGSQPLDRPHWIAPDALSVFGKTYYSGVTNISGASVDNLKTEIDNGNPVIVYGTYGFNNPRGWYGEVPINLHVMLMVGYNKKTGNIIINDPWGGVEIVISGASFAAQYNLMHYAVAIR